MAGVQANATYLIANAVKNVNAHAKAHVVPKRSAISAIAIKSKKKEEAYDE